MKKVLISLGGVIFGVALLSGIYFYLKNQETDYDSIIAQAAKRQREHSEFVDFYGEVEPEIPDKAANSRTLLGVDANNNGIRDDIDVWINRTALNMNETKGMRQYARAKQDWLKACEQRLLVGVMVDKTKLENAEICLMSVSDYKRLERGFAKGKLDLLILNTKERQDCLGLSMKNSEVGQNVDFENKNFNCEFEIQYLENVVSGNLEWKKSFKP